VRISGSVAVVTGASSGIGAATAVELVHRGAIVVAAARRESRLQSVIAPLGDAASYVVCDVSSDESVLTATRHVLDRHGRIDLLVNNAGTPLHRAFLDTPLAEMAHVMDVNWTGQLRWMKAALPSMVANGRGSVVNVASAAGLAPWTWEAAYSASKAAVIALTEAVAPELARAGVHCAWVAPGLVRTEIFSEEAMRHVPPRVRRSFMEPSVVAAAICDLVEREGAGVSVPRAIGFPPVVRQLLPRLYRTGLRRTYEATLRRDAELTGGE
jgi:short-subunit dehydrogenase